MEQRLIPVLNKLQAAQSHPGALTALLAKGLRAKLKPDDVAALKRMGLDEPKTLKDRAYAALLKGAMT